MRLTTIVDINIKSKCINHQCSFGETSEGKAGWNLVINSLPSGAQIYIDGQDSGKTTPSKVRVPSHSKFTVTLKLDGYLEYLKSNLTPDITGRSFTATLSAK